MAAKKPLESTESIGDWERTHYSKEISDKDDRKIVVLMGWVRALRTQGKITFIKLADRDGFSQIILKQGESKPNLIEKIEKLSRESVIAVKGTVKASKEAPNGWEVVPLEIRILSTAEAQLPLEVVAQKTPAEFHTRLESRFIDLRKPEVASIFKVKDLVTTAMREYLEGSKFIEIHTPKIISEASEGGSEVFIVKYFDRDAYLAQSPQFYKQMMMATGFDRVYEIAPAFRAEKSRTPRHVAEILMLDIEMAFIKSMEDVMKAFENMMKYVCEYVNKNGKNELGILNTKIDVPKTPFPHMTMKEAKQLLKKEKGLNYGEEDELDSVGEKTLGDIVKSKHGSDFVFLTEFPWSQAKFYHMQNKDNPKVANRCDLIFRGLEIATIAQREHRYDMLIKQADKMKVTKPKVQFYLNAFRYGMPPHGGGGLGVDRVAQQILNLPNVHEAILFPRTSERITP